MDVRTRFQAPIRIGDYLVDPARCVVAGKTGETHLEPKVMDVLCALAEREGEVAARSELVDSIWRERFGADESLSRAISILRKAFEGKPYIETIPKRGYCLTAPVVHAAGGSSIAADGDESPEPVSGAPGRRRPFLVALSMIVVTAGSIGVILWWPAMTPVQSVYAVGRVEVLPFDVLTDDPAARRFSAGLDANLRRALSVAGLEAAVDDRSAAADTPRPMAELTLEGSVDRDLDQLLVTAHIVHQEERVVLWSSQFQRQTDQLVALQSQVASKVAQVMRCGLASRAVQPDRMTTGVFALFLQSCGHLGSGDEFKLHDLAQRIIAQAPELAMAQALYAVASLWAGRASLASTLSSPTEDYVATARTAAERALEIDPDNGTANWALAMTHSGAPARWARFEAYLRKIDSADPSFPHALHHLMWLARATGRLGDAVDLQRRATQLDPYSPFKTAALAWLLAMTGALPEADVLLARAEKIWPNAFEVADYRLQIATWYRPPDVAEDVLRRSVARLGITDSGVACRMLLLDARRGHVVEPEHLRRTCSGHVREDFVSRVLASLGDVDGAYRELEGIDFSRFGETIFLFFPEMSAVRHDLRFMPLAQRIGLVDYWLRTDRWPDFCADPDVPYDCKGVAAALGRRASHVAQPPNDD